MSDGGLEEDEGEPAARAGCDGADARVPCRMAVLRKTRESLPLVEQAATARMPGCHVGWRS